MTHSDADTHQALSLAAVFQSALLADGIASTGRCPDEQARVLLEGAMNLAPASYAEVFPSTAALRPGLTMLRDALAGRQDKTPTNARTVGYALALVHLSSRLRRDSSLMSVLRNRLEALDAQRNHFNDLASSDFGHRLAGIYVDTLGTLKFRIKVQGEPSHLRNDDNAARIRALFLAGVRAAFLWHQAGGRRWHLLLRRKRLLSAVESALN